MKLIYHPIFLEHDTGMHPENANRLLSLDSLPETEVPSGEEFLTLVHRPAHIAEVKTACQFSDMLDPDTITSPGSYQAAIHAVGAAILASESGDFALVRPPGHHSYPDRSTGFCLFNNVAIAAQKLVLEGKRVLILDFDGHLGDGTSHIFEKTDEVLYWSLHQFPAFPGMGWVDEIGSEKGKGFTVNVPLPPGSGDDIFIHSLQSTMPIAEQFEPDVVAISAGFDAHELDPLLQLRVTNNSFYKIGAMLRRRFSNIFAVLEGGYNTQELPGCIYNFVAGINGEEMPYKQPHTESSRMIWEEYDLRISEVERVLKPFWKF